RAAIDLYRRRARGPEPVEPKDETAIALPPSMEGIWEAWQIRIALDMLPAEEREVVRDQHFVGLSHAQIAQQLAVPIGTVKSRSHRSHRRLASMLGHLAGVAACTPSSGPPTPSSRGAPARGQMLPTRLRPTPPAGCAPSCPN